MMLRFRPSGALAPLLFDVHQAEAFLFWLRREMVTIVGGGGDGSVPDQILGKKEFISFFFRFLLMRF
jgi:light-regulated signal transduction histidine kinase (bacteriophytochrome)